MKYRHGFDLHSQACVGVVLMVSFLAALELYTHPYGAYDSCMRLVNSPDFLLFWHLSLFKKYALFTGEYGNRIHDLVHAKHALCQLS